MKKLRHNGMDILYRKSKKVILIIIRTGQDFFVVDQFPTNAKLKKFNVKMYDEGLYDFKLMPRETDKEYRQIKKYNFQDIMHIFSKDLTKKDSKFLHNGVLYRLYEGITYICAYNVRHVTDKLSLYDGISGEKLPYIGLDIHYDIFKYFGAREDKYSIIYALDLIITEYLLDDQTEQKYKKIANIVYESYF